MTTNPLSTIDEVNTFFKAHLGRDEKYLGKEILLSEAFIVVRELFAGANVLLLLTEH